MKLLIPISYMGSGSSALTDLLQEFPGVRAPQGSFEFVFLHCPDGLFDLEDQLLVGNNALRSDTSLHRFLSCMRALHKGRWWVGNYRTRLHPNFAQIAEAFVEALVEAKPDFYWYEQEKYPKSTYPYLALRSLLRRLSGGRIQLKRPLTHDEMWLCWPSPDTFYQEARKFLQEVFSVLAPDSQSGFLVLDQLLLPHNLHRMPQYFPEGAEAFVIHRDPRDVFLSNKYIWAAQGEPVPYPTDPGAFCQMYRQLRACEQPVEFPCIHRIAFEDLVYRYEETREALLSCLNLPTDLQIPAQRRFDPARSIYNTQLFTLHKEWAAEAGRIAKELGEWLYDFPSARPQEEGSVF